MTNDLIPYDNNNGNDNESSEEDKARVRRIVLIILIVLIAMVVVLTFGWFYWKNEERKAEEKERKKQRLAEVEAAIKHIQAEKEKIEKTEKIIKISVRLGIGILLVFANLVYAQNKISLSDFDNVAGRLLNLNACIITIYSFIAFISYGSIENFVRRLKEILASILRRNHLDSLAELESLLLEREVLKKELEELENETKQSTEWQS
jgi:hypothetical protein